MLYSAMNALYRPNVHVLVSECSSNNEWMSLVRSSEDDPSPLVLSDGLNIPIHPSRSLIRTLVSRHLSLSISLYLSLSLFIAEQVIC